MKGNAFLIACGVVVLVCTFLTHNTYLIPAGIIPIVVGVVRIAKKRGSR